ncbi:MAG TPA: hypothetical protein VFM07_05925 [Intrasporangium sp.]|nr:hypothetical protein [Intrasporangium sp.]
MIGPGGSGDLPPDWVPEPVRREPVTASRLPAFGVPGDEKADATPSSGAAAVSLTPWQVGGLVALVVVPFVVWLLWSGLDDEELVPADQALPAPTATTWPWPGGAVPAPPRPTFTLVQPPRPTATYLLPPTVTVPGTRPTQQFPTARPTPLPPNLRPTPVPGGAAPKAVPTTVKSIRFELSGPTNRPYSVTLMGTATAGLRTFPSQHGTVVLELPASSLLPSPARKLGSLGVTAQASRATDLLTCRATVGGVTIAFRQGRGYATCTVMSSDLGWS